MESEIDKNLTGTVTNTRYFQTNFATVALMAISILPASVHNFPSEVHMPRTEYIRSGGAEYRFASEVGTDGEYIQILESFATKLIENLVDTEPEIALITKDRFLDMYEDF